MEEGAVFKLTPTIKTQTGVDYEGKEFTAFPEEEYHHGDFLFQDTAIDMNFFDKQKQFIESLSKPELDILFSYTKNGAYLINYYLRYQSTDQELLDYIKKFSSDIGPVRLSEVTLENVRATIKLYVQSFEKVFNKVPRLTSPLRLFRGLVPTKYHDPRKDGLTSPTLDYWSTTYAPTDSSAPDAFTHGSCCMVEIVATPGVRVLWVEPFSHHKEEHEIILDKNVKLKLTGCATQKWRSDIVEEIESYEFEVSAMIGPIQRVSEFVFETCSFITKRLTGKGKKTKKHPPLPSSRRSKKTIRRYKKHV